MGGCTVVGITISTEQLELARERVRQNKALSAGQVNLILYDYRKLGIGNSEYKAGSFDAIISIEMLEAVGADHLAEYYATVHRMLRRGGRATVQVISNPNERYEAYCKSSDFIRKHIFPGAHLPCLDALDKAS